MIAADIRRTVTMTKSPWPSPATRVFGLFYSLIYALQISQFRDITQMTWVIDAESEVSSETLEISLRRREVKVTYSAY